MDLRMVQQSTARDNKAPQGTTKHRKGQQSTARGNKTAPDATD
jgi:hypothetical protein